MSDEIPIGTTRSFPKRVCLDDGVTPSTAFLSTDLLFCSVWAGDDQATAISPSCTWIDATTADYSINFAPADTATRTPGTYRIRVVAARGGLFPEILRDAIELLATPGVATARPVYCTYQDMALHCSWVGQYLDSEDDQAGFAEQRAAAREWMDGLILRSQPRGGGLNLVSMQNYWTWDSGSGGGYYGMGLAVDRVLRAQLDAGGLVLTGPHGRQAVRACAYHALAAVFGGLPDPSMQRFAGLFMRKAQAEASTLVVEIDPDADGVSEYAIALSATNTRYA